MGKQDFYVVQPDPEMGPEMLGIPPPPQPPMMQQAPPLPSQQGKGKALAIASLIAAVAGGRDLYGLPAGVLRGQRIRDDQADMESRRITQENARNQGIYLQQEEMFNRAMQQRQTNFMQMVGSLRSQMKDITDKEDYERQIEGFASLLQNGGYRVDANYLRKAVPFVAQSSEKQATALLDGWLKNTNNQKLWATDPKRAAESLVPFDRDGDGIKEDIKIRELAALAGRPFAANAITGQPEFAVEETTLPEKANADGILKMLVEKDKAEGKRATPERMIELQKQAMTAAKEAQTLPKESTVDPELAGIRKETAELRRDLLQGQVTAQQNAPAMSPRLQASVASQAKGFDSLPIVKRVQTMGEAVSFANGLDPNTNNPADDQALIYAFAKAMDPDSVVREGEYATVQHYAQQWAATFGFNAARIFSNVAFLTPQARANMKKTIQARYAPAKAQYDNVRRSYGQKIDKMTGQPGSGESFLTDYGGALPNETGSAPASAAPGVPSYQEYLRRKGQR